MATYLLILTLVYGSARPTVDTAQVIGESSCNEAAAKWLQDMEKKFGAHAKASALCIQQGN